MPPKKPTKAEEKKKVKIVEDRTFGLKNKSKSKAVQKFVQATHQSVLGGSMDAKAKATKEKQERRAAKEAREAELRALGLAAADDKKDKKDEFKSSAEAEDYLWTAEDFDYVADETTLEETLQAELDALRADLASGKVKGTPVNPDTFAAWEEKRRKEAEKAARRAQAKFKKTGGGMSGRALFDFDATLFKDDDDADEEIDYDFGDEEDDDTDSDSGSDSGSEGGAGPAGGDAEDGAAEAESGAGAAE